MKQKKSSYENLQGNIRTLKTPAIEVWENKYQDKDYTISLEIPEFTCICPKTGLPDFALIKIQYGPAKYCLELKSLKIYFVFYRNMGVFHEHLTNKILEDVVKYCQPKWAKIEVVMNPRGWIATSVMAEYKRK